MVHTEIAGNDARIAHHPGPGEAVVVTRYGKPQFVVLRWEDFAPLEAMIDEFLAAPPYELKASDTAVRADALDRAPEGDDFDYGGLADALGR